MSDDFPSNLGSVHTHETVAVANNAMVFFEDDDKYLSEQVTFLAGGFVKFEYEGDSHIVPRERITAVIGGGLKK